MKIKLRKSCGIYKISFNMNVHEWNGHLEIFSRLQVTENSERVYWKNLCHLLCEHDVNVISSIAMSLAAVGPRSASKMTVNAVLFLTKSLKL